VNWSELGFYRVAAVSPRVHVADPAANAAEIVAWAKKAAAEQACVALFPELAVTGYTCEDLFHTEGLLRSAREALGTIAKGTAELPLVVVVGAPLRTEDGRVYNAAFVLHRGVARGAVPKSHVPNYGEFYERRWFVPGPGVEVEAEGVATKQLFVVGRMVFAVEICEDLWAPSPPSVEHALAGANVILNPSASNEWVAKADYRRDLVRQQSARLNAGYVYVSCGPSESTKDVVYGGHAMAAENGVVVAEGKRFGLEGSMLVADLDIEKLLHERARNITFGCSPAPAGYRVERLAEEPSLASLRRAVPSRPFVPDDPTTRDERAHDILEIQSTGLARRIESCGAKAAVLGLSGGLDSTLAVIVAVEAVKRLGRPAREVVAVSMPGFGTTERTKTSASTLASTLGVTFREIPIRAAVEQHFQDIGHDPAKHDLVYQNAQARERTQVLFDVSNQVGGIVVGTGDLTELALGWCTFNADHMAGYNVNASVPKTLVKHLVRWYAERRADAGVREVLEAVLATVISPELLPPDAKGPQSTEESVGPLDLHDFFLYHFVRNGSGARRIHALACRAFEKEHDPAAVKRWLRVFVERFHRQQFKRTVLPAGPKVGSVSLSPRGDWRMPDEAETTRMVEEVEKL
jgi:NAD+ synthase (glutamine-hydrolysing)